MGFLLVGAAECIPRCRYFIMNLLFNSAMLKYFFGINQGGKTEIFYARFSGMYMLRTVEHSS